MKYFIIIFFFLLQKMGYSQYDIGNHKSTIFMVRHAEKQAGNDPALTKEGNMRAGDLMRKLKNEKIKRMYVSEYKRTWQTADSLRIQFGIDTVHYLADTSCIDLFNAITKHGDWDKTILIISHSNILQKIIYKLGVTGFPQQNIPDNEFDNLFMVNFKKNKAKLKLVKYGKPSSLSATMTGLQ
jgi:2,3-bisphosphoglycerate-dependent phosphoglycerate mutase